MEVLVTGGDTELGRAIAQGFRDADHRVTLAGARANELEVAAKELDAEAIVCDNTDPASLTQARGLFPHHLDTVVNVPAPRCQSADPRTYSLADLAASWRNALDDTVLAAVLTVQTVGDHLRSGGSIISVVPETPRDGSADAALKAALSNWTAGQATAFGTRGITVNVVAAGSGTGPGYDGLTRGQDPLAGDTPRVGAEITRLALFLTTPAARHITGQTLHVSHGALTRFG
jgi:NAD(P)-dependent dehydrogenase (short-subunit alcohol dehydrogenase family)